MSLDWYPRQKVVCIREAAWQTVKEGAPTVGSVPVKGRIYTIREAYTIDHPEFADVVFLKFVEISSTPDLGFACSEFRPLEDIHNAIFRNLVSPENLKKFREVGALERALERLQENR